MKRIFGEIEINQLDAIDKKDNLNLLNDNEKIGLKIVRNRQNICRWFKDKLTPKELIKILEIKDNDTTEMKLEKLLNFTKSYRKLSSNQDGTTDKGYYAATNGYSIIGYHDVTQFWYSGEMALYLCAYKHKKYKENGLYVWAWQLCTGVQDVNHLKSKTNNSTGATEKVDYYTHQYEIEVVKTFLTHHKISIEKYDNLLTQIKHKHITKTDAIKTIREKEDI